MAFNLEHDQNATAECRQRAGVRPANLVGMDLNLTGRTAVITGGSKGIGLAIAATLAREGMQVVVGCRR
jgi:5,10-methylene-tetrahydrofolate dehydrogenase/methenyl tetrahydrofolate cyclohydrolase